jgi:hypothetical protein
MSGTLTYYTYAGKTNIGHAAPCWDSTYTTTKDPSLVPAQSCPADPCIEMARYPDSKITSLMATPSHDFDKNTKALDAKLPADTDTVEPSSIGTSITSLPRFFVKFDRKKPKSASEAQVIAQCRVLQVHDKATKTLVIAAVGHEVSALPTGESVVVPDPDPATSKPLVDKIHKGDTDAGTYLVSVGGSVFSIIALPSDE